MSVNAKRNGTLVGGLLIMLCVGILYMWSISSPMWWTTMAGLWAMWP